MVGVGLSTKYICSNCHQPLACMLARSFSASDTAMQNALQVSNAGEWSVKPFFGWEPQVAGEFWSLIFSAAFWSFSTTFQTLVKLLVSEICIGIRPFTIQVFQHNSFVATCLIANHLMQQSHVLAASLSRAACSLYSESSPTLNSVRGILAIQQNTTRYINVTV